VFDWGSEITKTTTMTSRDNNKWREMINSLKNYEKIEIKRIAYKRTDTQMAARNAEMISIEEWTYSDVGMRTHQVIKDCEVMFILFVVVLITPSRSCKHKNSYWCWQLKKELTKMNLILSLKNLT
jgi:hypothetical protein